MHRWIVTRMACCHFTRVCVRSCQGRHEALSFASAKLTHRISWIFLRIRWIGRYNLPQQAKTSEFRSPPYEIIWDCRQSRPGSDLELGYVNGKLHFIMHALVKFARWSYVTKCMVRDVVSIIVKWGFFVQSEFDSIGGEKERQRNLVLLLLMSIDRSGFFDWIVECAGRYRELGFVRCPDRFPLIS